MYFIKLGIVHTKEITGFEERKPQTVMKVAQDKITESRRGKRAKAKGTILYEDTHENYLLVDAKKFVIFGERMLSYFETKHEGIVLLSLLYNLKPALFLVTDFCCCILFWREVLSLLASLRFSIWILSSVSVSWSYSIFFRITSSSSTSISYP